MAYEHKPDMDEMETTKDYDLGDSSAVEAQGVAHDPKAVRRAVRKVDWHLLPILGALYTIALVDRSNVGVARISGMDDDLGLTVGNRASIILMVFFISYILFEIPSNAVLHRLGAANCLSFYAVAWGAVTLGMGFLQNWQGLAVLRVLLGLFEAGYYPGCIYLVSSWYCRFETQRRMAIFFLTGSALSAFANILAYGIIQIANYHPYKGWRWIYIIEGTITVLAGIASRFIIVDFPDSPRNKFLSDDEKLIIQSRLAEDRGPEEREPVTFKKVLQTARDWKPWTFAIMYSAGAVGIYAFLFFLPIILRGGLGYSLKMSFILSTPPSLFSVVVVMVVSWAADKLRMRGPFIILQGILGIVGLCMTGFLESPTPRYVGTFLGVAAANGFVVTTLAWQANNLVGDAKRAISTALMISCSGVGGIYSSMVFRQQDAPNYFPGIIAVIAIYAAGVVAAIVTMIVLKWQNKRADEGKYVCEGRPGFRYTL